MKLAIFGATGRTGKLLVEQTLEAGNEVSVLVRNPEKLSIQHEQLSVIQGDAMNPADVEKVVQGTDAVISVLGRTPQSPPQMHEVATRNIVSAMEKYGVRRLVSLTGAGVDAPQDRPKLANHLIKFALKTLSGEVLRDAEAHAEIIRGSSLDWVLVRVPRLVDGPHTGKYRVGWVGINTGTSISRADVAAFLLKQATDNTYVHQAPMISE